MTTFIGSWFNLFNSVPLMTYAETDAPLCRCGGVEQFGGKLTSNSIMLLPGQFAKGYCDTTLSVGIGQLERLKHYFTEFPVLSTGMRGSYGHSFIIKYTYSWFGFGAPAQDILSSTR